MELAIAAGVIEKLSALMVEKTYQEIALVCNFNRDFKWLKQLTSIHDFLADANSRAVEDKLVKTWLHNVREVAWDAEDIVEEYALHTSNNVTLSCFCDSFFRYKMAKRIQKVHERIKSITKDGEQLKFLRDLALSLSEHPSSSGARKENSLLLRDSHPVGIDSKVVELIEAIESRDSVIVVVAGIGGVGKTLLLKNVYNKIKGRIEERYDYSIWLSISKSYSVENLGRDLMSQIKGNTNNVSEANVAEQIHDALQGKKSFVVLDDVWWRAGEENIIESLGLPVGPNSHCKVVVTTRDQRVCENHAAAVAYNMKPLSEEDSWRLFCYHAFGGNRLPAAGLEGIAREVVKKCGSLPLALKTVGASLSGCTETRRWESKLHQLEVADPNYSKYSVMKVLKLSYDSLLPSLKVCFSYLSFFPEDEIIDAEYLVNLWIAEGFISQLGEDQWDTAWGYLYELANLCLLEVEEDEFLVKHCKVHDLLHDLAIVISREHQSKFAVDDDLRSAKRILLQKKEITKMAGVQPRASCPKSLRTMSLYQNPIERIGEKFVRHVRFLRVLDLSATHISTLPACVGKLKLLKLLNLSRTKIKDVPKCVRSLKSLLFLDVSHCEQLESLPKWVDKLKCLQHFNIKGCQDELLGKMPREISELVALRVLRSWYLRLSIEEDGFLKLEDIAKLTCLQEISLQVEDEMQLTSFGDRNLRWPPKMRHLSIELRLSDVSYQLPNLSEMRHLQTLNLSYFAFPIWVCKLTDLVELSLVDCDCEFYPELQALPNLKKLVLDGNKSCRKLPEAFGKKSGFPKLRFFHIQRFSVLEELPDFEDGAMAALEKFYVGLCPLVSKVPAGFECLTKLRRIEYTGDRDDGLDKNQDFWNNIRASINDKRRSSQVEISVTII